MICRWMALAVLSVALIACSGRKVTDSADFGGRPWHFANEDEKPWFFGEKIDRVRYSLAPGSDRALIFVMGDGVQGYSGRISGLSWFKTDIVEVIKFCSGEDMHIERSFHNYFVILRGSKRDREAVKCVRKLTNRRFSAVIGPASLIGSKWDTAPFQQFENKAN